MIKLTSFTREDAFAFQGAENFPDGSVPRIYYFSDSQTESFHDLMGMVYDKDDCNSVYIIHHADGMEMGWVDGDLYPTVSWAAGEVSEHVENLLQQLPGALLPMWAMSVAKSQCQDVR